MGLLASVFPGRFPVTRSHQPAVLSAPLELPRSGSVRIGREGEGRKETGFRVYGLVPLGGFNRSEHRPHRPECGFCPFAIRRVRPAMPRGGATGGGRVGLQFPPLRLCLLGDGGWSIPATLCTAPLSLILGSASVYRPLRADSYLHATVSTVGDFTPTLHRCRRAGSPVSATRVRLCL